MLSLEANYDIIFLLSFAKSQYDELHKSEINLLAYLAMLLSIYDGRKSHEWGYLFSYHSFGGPDCYELHNEIENLTTSGIIRESKNDYLCVDYYISFKKYLLELERFKWRKKYLQTSIDACLTKSLPLISIAINEEPGISSAKKLQRKIVLHSSDNTGLYEDFKALKCALGDLRENIIIPASVWIEYLLMSHCKSQEVLHDRQ